MRIGLFGGSFDPVHLGHLIMAEHVREALKLDQVRFIPARVSPLKQENPPAKEQDRLEMLRLAIGGHPDFAIETLELDREGPSFTVDTLKELTNLEPSNDWFYFMGADSLLDFHRWKSPREICELVQVMVLYRGGMSPPAIELLMPFLSEDKAAKLDEYVLQTPHIEISSSDIRRRIRTGASIRYLVPSAVEAYISANQLYQ